MMYETASIEPLEVIRQNECEGDGNLTTLRFRALWNEIERLRKGIQDYLDGDYEPRVKKNDKCHHGVYGFEICENCTDEHFARLLKQPISLGA